MNERTSPPEGGDTPQTAAPPPERTVLASAEEVAAVLAAQTAGAPMAAPPVSTPPPFPSPPPLPAMIAHGSPDALLGIQLNDLFEVTRFIAQGGMGIVYEGRNIASNERVAIKVILPQYASDQQFMALFRREASALERIGHDSLVKYRALAFDRGRGINYLVIEYVDGLSLAEALTGAPADPAVTLRLLRRLALGLSAAHEAGVIHRDLSPDNVLLPGGAIERAKIIDFGIAKDTNPGEKSVVGEAFAGKFGYAAPEIFGKYGRRIGPWTDIYSLALVVAAQARGTPVDMGVTIVDALDARGSVPDLTGIAAEVREVLERMLAPDPADRYQTMDEVAEAADPRAAGYASMIGPPPVAPPSAAPVFVRADTVVPAAVPPPRSRMPLIAGAAAVALALAGVGGWLATRGGDTAPAAEPTVVGAESPVEPAAPIPAAASAAPPWETARDAVAQALAALPCVDLRVTDQPISGRARLAGWRASDTAIPATAGGWALDATQVRAVASPSAETCRLIDALRRAAPSDLERYFSLPGARALALASAPRDADGNLLLDLQVTNRPPGRALFTSIDDRAADAADRVASGDAEAEGLRFGAVPFEAKPSRYLMVLIASPTRLPNVTAAGPSPALARACADGGCKLASGWVEVTP